MNIEDKNIMIIPSNKVYRQRIKFKPIECHYEDEGEPPYIKYDCPICHEASKNCKDKFEGDKKFVRCSIPYGTLQCPICGVNLIWE